MKINLLQPNISRSGLHSESFREKNDCGVKKRGYNANYCGSFTGKSEAAATVMKKSFLDKILSKDWFGSFAKYSQEHNISTSALIALVLAGILRPATIMALPGQKDKEDKIYASGHAVASGIIGFVVSTIITSPLDEAIKKVFNNDKFKGPKLAKMDEEISNLSNDIKEAEKNIKSLDEIKLKAMKLELKAKNAVRGNMDILAKNIPDWIIGVPRAVLTIALIPPILKYVFGVEKKKKQPPLEAPKMDFVKSPAFEAVKGGVQ